MFLRQAHPKQIWLWRCPVKDNHTAEKYFSLGEHVFKHAGQMFTNKWGNLFSIYSTMVLLCSNYTLSICNYYHKKRNIRSWWSEQHSLLCLQEFLFQWNQNQIPLQAWSGHISWSSTLVKRVPWLRIAPSKKNTKSSSQKFPESLQWTSWANLSLNFRSFLVRIPFLWTQPHFRSAYRKTLSTLSSLMNGGMPIFTITLFEQKFLLFLQGLGLL